MFSKIIAGLLPVMPRAIVRRVASRYIAGDDAGAALSLATRLEEMGFVTTLDMLGEDIEDMGMADGTVRGYLELMRSMADAGLERNISIKLTGLGVRIDEGGAFDNLSKILEGARERDFFVRIDMEDSSLTDLTLDFYLRSRQRWPRVGAVLQARLKRTADDARRLAGKNANFRLCKGIYPENPTIAHFDADTIREAYLDILERLIAGGTYVGIATHDEPMIARAEEILKRIPDGGPHEFQALLGVPMRRTLERLKTEGHKVRLYVPFGPDWYAYSLRRLKENPKMAGAIAKGIFKADRLDVGPV